MASKPSSRCLKIERLGGFAGFGMGNLKSEGEIDLDALPEEERLSIERLLKGGGPGGGKESRIRDGFRYRISWEEDGKACSVEVDESEAPATVRAAVKDRLV